MKKLPALVLVLLLSFASIVQASTTDDISDYQSQLSENQARQEELQQKIDALQAEERSLQNQIDYMDSQIALTNLKISEAETKIAERQVELEGLATDIETLIARIGRIEESVQYQHEVYGQRLRARYKSSRVSAFEILFGADSLSDVFARLKYLRMMEQQDRRLISQMNDTQHNYKNQKELLEEIKQQVELVKQELEQEKINLDAHRADLNLQRKGKEYLLIQTRNDETIYQRLLEEARAEQRAIEQAILGLKLEDGTAVKAGDTIALMGNSGYPYCSTGAHLHFAVRRGDQFVNPADYLTKRRVLHDLPDGSREEITVGGGDWDWPLADPIVVSQLYGKTPYSWRYPSGLHDGLDMYNKTNFAITAVADGTLYSGSMMCDKATMNYVAIDHGEGLVTWYFHTQ